MALACWATLGSPSVAARVCGDGLPRYQPRAVAIPREAGYLNSAGAVRIVGYNDMRQILAAIDALFTVAHPGIRFQLILEGTRSAPPALIAGRSLFAPMGAAFEDSASRAYRAALGADPLMIRIAHDSLRPAALSSPIGIFVSKANPLARLSLDEARRAFAAVPGRAATRWGDLGLTGDWAKRPIHPVGLASGTAIGELMRRGSFAGLPYAPGFVGLRQSREVIARVSDDPQALGFADLSLTTPAVKPLALAEHRGGPCTRGSSKDLRSGRYPLDRHLLIYLRRSAEGRLDPVASEYLRLLLSCEGQAVIAAGSLGYIPLSAREAAAERAKFSAGR